MKVIELIDLLPGISCEALHPAMRDDRFCQELQLLIRVEVMMAAPAERI
jgi:hypothetical protein